MDRRHVGGSLSGEVVELDGGDAVVDARDDLLGDLDRIDVRAVETVA